jgi:L-threonylcarbamoyladenylate synthase
VTRVMAMADAGARQSASRFLAAGSVVVFPTDTVYGIGALPTPDAVQELYLVKGRPPTKPIPLLLANASDMERYSPETSDLFRSIVAAYWPGPLTVVLRARSEIALTVGSTDGTVGFRVPAHDDLRDLIDLCGGALAVTSANRSGEPETRSATEARGQLGSAVPLVLDGGHATGAAPSTVIGVRGDEVTLLRNGALWTELSGYARTRGATVRDSSTVRAGSS